MVDRKRDERGRPLVSPRPQARPDFNAPRYTDPVLRGEDGRVITIADTTNPVTQLGQTQGSAFRVYEPNDLNARGLYLSPSDDILGGDQRGTANMYYRDEYPDRNPLKINDVVLLGSGLENTQTPAHEFMHRGFNLIREQFPKEEIERRYGSRVANTIHNPSYEHYLVQAVIENEGHESFNDYQTEGGLKEESREFVKSLVDPLYELAREASGEAGFITDRDRGPRRRPNNRMPEEKGFFAKLFGYAEGGSVEDQMDGMLSEFTGVDTTPYSRPEPKNEDLEVDAMSLPIGANPETDWYVGQNELGEKTYRMSNGREYTIRRVIPQDRFTTEAGTLDRLNEVVGDRVTGFVEGTKQAVTAAGRALSGEGVTYGDVLNNANYLTGLGVGTSVASRTLKGQPLYQPEMASIFGGPEARNAPVRDVIESFNKESGRNDYDSSVGPISVDDPHRTLSFNRILDDIEQNPGQYPETIAMLEANGWYTGRDDLLRFEIDDSQSKVNPEYFTYHTVADIEKFGVGPQVSSRSYLPDVLDHPELFEQYPDLKNYSAVLDVDLAGQGTLGYFVSDKNTIVINPDLLKNPRELRATLLHEANHAVQEIEGFTGGSDKVSPEVYTISQAYLNSPEAIKAIQDYENNLAAYNAQQEQSGLKRFIDRVRGREPISKPVKPTIVDDWVIYSNNIGEVESRNVESRMDFTPEQRRLNPPEKTEDRSPGLQWGSRELNRIRSGENPFDVFPTNMSSEITGGGTLTRRPGYAEGGSVEDQMGGMLSEFTGVDTTPAPERKGLSYGQLLIDNIVGLDNGYDSFGEKLGRAFNDDEVGFLKQAGLSAWEGAKQFVSHPIQTTEEVVTDIKDSVVRLGSEDLDARLQRMYGVDYTQASDEQVNKAREAVFGDALEAANLIPAGGAALKLGRTIGKTGVAADVIGTTRALASGDLDFLGGTPTPRANTAGIGAQVSQAAPARLNPLFTPRTDGGLRGYHYDIGGQQAGSVVADFYSPARTVLETIDIPNKGLKGSEAIKLLRNNPDVRQSEIDTIVSGIDPLKRYTREELLSDFDRTAYVVTAERPTSFSESNFGGSTYENAHMQRQALRDTEELDYQETIIRAQRPEGTPGFLASMGTHHTDDTIAHLRTSIQQDMDTGQKFYLIEEIQSDLVARSPRKPRGEVDFSTGFLDEADVRLRAISGAKVLPGEVRSMLKSERDFLKEFALARAAEYTDMFRQRGRSSFGPDDPEYLSKTESFLDKYANGPRSEHSRDANNAAYDYLTSRGYSDSDARYTIERVEDVSQEILAKPVSDITRAISEAPIKDEAEVVRLALQTAISDAVTSQVPRVVIPNLERILEQRFRNNSPGFENGLKPNSGFYKIYVTGLNKAIEQLQQELPEMVVRQQNLPHRNIPHPGRDQFLPSTATVLDLRAYSGQDLSRLRFAEGGMVDPKDNPVFRHHLENVRTGNSVKNEDGTVSTIRTIIVGDGENEYLIPTVWGGRILSDEEAFNKAMSTGIDWPKAPAGRAGIKYLEKLDRQIHSGFAEGGLAMETQMNRLMAEGGLNDDGMRVDPVSGNEVPPGSMVEEVRDDIPAQLSGGEYVVPADVVRYYGVRFFEDLRGQAKAGLTEMEQDGRIGGEPAGMEQGPVGLSEEDMMLLQQIASQKQQGGGYAEGGMVNQPFNEDALIDNIINVAKNNPDLMGKLNQRGVMLYEGGMVKPGGYADGGSVGSPTFNPADWGVVGGSYFGPSTSYQAPIENRIYRGPLGETITIRFQNGVAIDPIPVGFVPDAEYVAAQTTSNSNGGGRDRDQPFTPPTTPTTSTEPDDPYKYRGADWNNPYEAGMEALKSTEGTIGNRLITGLASVALGPLGGAASKGYLISNGLANARANLRILEEKGMTEEADKLRAEIEKRADGVSGIMGMFASGDRIFENLMNQINEKTTVSPTGVRTTGRVVSAADQLKDVAGLAAAKAMTPAQVQAGIDYASTGDSRDDSWSGGQVVSNQNKPKTSTAQEARDKAQAAADKLGKPLATGGRARGGLMGKANKT